VVVVVSAVILSTSLLPASAQYEDIVGRAKPAVVLIINEKSSGTSRGTGFFIDANGYIVTSRHVIEDSNRITVLTADGKRLPAWVVRYSTVFDAAVIKVTGVGFRTLQLGDTNSDIVRPGQDVFVVGYTGGMVPGLQAVPEVSATRGIVIALHPAAGLIQIDAAINLSNSGGPVLNGSGRVIGIAVSRLEKLAWDRPPQQINFAVEAVLLDKLTVELSPGEIPAPRSIQSSVAAQGTVILSGRVTIGPFCPGPTQIPPCPGPPDLYSSRKLILRLVPSEYAADSEAGKPIEVKLNPDGTFQTRVIAGTYKVDITDCVFASCKQEYGAPTTTDTEPDGTTIVTTKGLPATVFLKLGHTVLDIAIFTGMAQINPAGTY
jgi:hypothetical protein